MEVIAPMSEVPRSVASLDREVAAMRAAHARVLARVAEHDEAGTWHRDGATCSTGWLAARYGLSRGTARTWVRVARALRDLPRIAAAYSAGRLAWDQLVPLVRLATASADAMWARRAPSLRPAALWGAVRRAERVRRRGADAARRMRFLHISRDLEHPVVWLEGALPAEEGAALEQAVAGRAEQVAVEPGLPDPQAARMADALVELATRQAKGRGPVPTLVVHAGAEVLVGAKANVPAPPVPLGETEAGDRLTDEAVRRIACDARMEWVLEEHGRPVGVGRQSRTVPGWLARLLRHRDHGCRFPGCERKRWTRAHHIVHWADEGRTDLDNLVTLCHAHHRLVHEGGWSISGHPAKVLRFRDPTGRPIRAGPE